MNLKRHAAAEQPAPGGAFVVLEGTEGVGKTTQIHAIRDHLENLDQTVVLTREPGGTRLAEDIRAILLDKANTEMTNKAELLLIFAARAEHVDQVINPALKAGQWVVSDRFTDATYAYQGGGRGIAVSDIETIEHWTLGRLVPDRVFLLDAPPEIGMRRMMRRGVPDRFERERLEFFQRVRAAYLERAGRNSDRYQIVDAGKPAAEVTAAILDGLAELSAARIARR